jgi:hypothetical protein
MPRVEKENAGHFPACKAICPIWIEGSIILIKLNWHSFDVLVYRI